jgi:hypothetical protein
MMVITCVDVVGGKLFKMPFLGAPDILLETIFRGIFSFLGALIILTVSAVDISANRHIFT